MVKIIVFFESERRGRKALDEVDTWSIILDIIENVVTIDSADLDELMEFSMGPSKMITAYRLSNTIEFISK